MSRWQDAAFEQEHLLHHIDGYLGDLLDGYQESAYGHNTESDANENFPTAPVLRMLTREMLTRSDPIYVADNSQQLWEHARDHGTWEMEPLRRSDLVVPAGFALLPRATYVKDQHGRNLAYRAISWMPVSASPDAEEIWDEGQPGMAVWVVLWSHVEDDDDYSGSDARKLFARQQGWRWTVLHATAISFDKDVWEDWYEYDQEAAAGIYRNLKTFWTLMSQLVPVKAPLQRQARRQRARKWPQLVPDVTVIHLRRPRGDLAEDHEAQAVDWSHQWMVRGHWRNQPYGPRNNPEYKQIWIAPYVKGPEDKPLQLTKRAFEFDR